MAQQQHGRWLRRGVWMAVISTSLLLLGPLWWATQALAPAFARALDRAQPWLALWRAAVFLLLIGGWPWWVEWRASSLSGLIFLKCFWAYFWRFL